MSTNYGLNSEYADREAWILDGRETGDESKPLDGHDEGPDTYPESSITESGGATTTVARRLGLEGVENPFDHLRN